MKYIVHVLIQLYVKFCLLKCIQTYNLNICINKIINTYFNCDNLIIWDDNSDEDFIIPFPYTLQNRRENKFNLPHFRKASEYIIFGKKTRLKNIIDFLESSKMFQSNVKFLLILDTEVDTAIMKVLIDYYIYNIVIIESLTEKLFTFFPYDFENLNKPRLDLKFLGSCANITTYELYANKIPRFWNNSTIYLQYIKVQPYTKSCPKCDRLGGLEIDLFNDVKEKLKFKIKFQAAPSWGRLLNGSYTNVLKAIKERKAHTALGSFLPRSGENLDFDLSVPFCTNKFVWIFPRASKLAAWKKMFKVFSSTSWIVLGLTFLILIIGHGILAKQSLSLAFLSTLKYFIVTSMRSYKKFTARVLQIHLVFFFLILSSLYNAQLIKFLIKDTRDYQIHTLEEAFRNGFRLSIHPQFIQLYSSLVNDDIENFANRFISCSIIDLNCTVRVAYEKNIIYSQSTPSINYRIYENFIDKDGEEMIFVSNDVIMLNYLYWYFYKGFPMFQQINTILDQLRMGGFPARYSYLLDHQMHLKYRNIKHQAIFENKPLTIMNLSGIFIFLIIGWAISFSAFIKELLFP